MEFSTPNKGISRASVDILSWASSITQQRTRKARCYHHVALLVVAVVVVVVVVDVDVTFVFVTVCETAVRTPNAQHPRTLFSRRYRERYRSKQLTDARERSLRNIRMLFLSIETYIPRCYALQSHRYVHAHTVTHILVNPIDWTILTSIDDAFRAHPETNLPSVVVSVFS